MISSLWGSSGSNIYAAGEQGLLYQYDGENWNNLQSGPLDLLNGVCAGSDNTIIAVGESGVSIKWIPDGWETIDTGVTENLNHICGTADSAIAVGAGGTILKWDGSVWSSMNSGTEEELLCIRQEPGGVFYTVGTNDTVLRYKNNEWTSMPTGFDVDLNGVWASSESDLFVVGERIDYKGTIFHWDGSSWTLMENGSDKKLYDIYGFSSDNVFAAGEFSLLMHYDGNYWSLFNTTDLPNISFNRLGGHSEDKLYAVGYNGGILKFDGSEWRYIASGTRSNLNDVCTVGNDQLFIAGDYGTVLSANPYPASCDETGTTLWMPSNEFRPGDPCECCVTVCNNTGSELNNYPLFVILDVYGALYFAPSFANDVDFYNLVLPVNETHVTVIEEFIWPSGTGSASGIIWIAALTNPEISEIFGTWDSWDFGWED